MNVAQTIPVSQSAGISMPSACPVCGGGRTQTVLLNDPTVKTGAVCTECGRWTNASGKTFRNGWIWMNRLGSRLKALRS